VGVLGLLSAVAGADALGASDGRFGEEVHFYVGGRLSIVSVVYFLLKK
jgi:hypothetical protein